MWSINRYSFAVLLFLPAASGQSLPTRQPNKAESPRFGELERNRARLLYSLSLENTAVLPGEDFCVNFTIRNDSGMALEVFDPFGTARSRFDMFVWTGGEWKGLTPDPASNESISPSDPTVWFSINQITTRRFCAIDDKNEEGGFQFYVDAPGRYRLVYGYSHTSVDFTSPQISMVELVRSKLPKTTMIVRCRCASDGMSIPVENEIRSAVVVAGAEHFIVAGRFATNGPMSPPMPGNTRDVAKAAGIFPFVRIAGAHSTMSGIQLSADSEEHAVVSWINEGRRELRHLGHARRPVE